MKSTDDSFAKPGEGYKWSDGTAVDQSFMPWQPGEPNNGEVAKSAEIELRSSDYNDFKWNDRPLIWTPADSWYICEKRGIKCFSKLVLLFGRQRDGQVYGHTSRRRNCQMKIVHTSISQLICYARERSQYGEFVEKHIYLSYKNESGAIPKKRLVSTFKPLAHELINKYDVSFRQMIIDYIGNMFVDCDIENDKCSMPHLGHTSVF